MADEIEIVDDDTTPPDSLSHYTNLAGFLGIIETGQMWASNVAFLNDREELLHGIRCAKDAITNLAKDRELRPWRDAVRGVYDQIVDGRMPNTYVSCFCTKSDALSQWRGYGGNEQGICLTFHGNLIEGLHASKKSMLVPVVYGEYSGRSKMMRALREKLAAYPKDELDGLDDQDKQEAAYRLLSALVPRFKHGGFKSEDEWRFVVQQETLRTSVCFRALKNVIVPYIKLDPGSGSLPLKSIRVGPGYDMQLTQRSVKQFLKAKGYDVPVFLSKVPFRT